MAIRVVAMLANEAEVQQKLLAITAEYAEVFRQEFMNLIGEEIIEEAKSNIEIGAQSSRTPPTHNLARSLRHSINKQGVLSVFAGETGPSSLYAHIHNVPRGQYTTLRAHRDYMKFFWYRYNVPMKKEVVYRPGTGFLSEAFVS